MKGILKQEQEEHKERLAQFEEKEAVVKSPWIHAWSDSVAGVHAFQQQMCLADLKDDGDYKLVVADSKGKLKIYQGTNVLLEDRLAEKPVAVEVTYPNNKKPSK